MFKKDVQMGRKKQMKQQSLLFGLSLNFHTYIKSMLMKNQALATYGRSAAEVSQCLSRRRHVGHGGTRGLLRKRRHRCNG